MPTIWKFEIVPSDGHEVTLTMPRGARVLCAREQRDTICVWAEVDRSAPLEPRRFEVFGTGWDLPPGERRYLGTASIYGGSLIFHVYEPAAVTAD